MNFEDTIKELEQVVARLENGDTGLDESMELFERGIKLSKQCQNMLDNAEKKIRVIMEDGNEEDFSEGIKE